MIECPAEKKIRNPNKGGNLFCGRNLEAKAKQKTETADSRASDPDAADAVISSISSSFSFHHLGIFQKWLTWKLLMTCGCRLISYI